MKNLLLIPVVFFFACSEKEVSHEPSPADRQTASEVQSFLSERSFRIWKYYADRPIDYYPDDTIGLTTDLFQFVSGWIKDDSNYFHASGGLDVTQNSLLYSEDSSPVIKRTWGVVADDKGVHFDYLSYVYNPLRYEYVGRTDSTITVQVHDNENGANLVTVFKVL